MLKKLTTIFAVMVLFSITANAQWENLGAWPDTSYKGGSHGIAVDPDGKVWTTSYYQTGWVTPDADTINTSPIYIFEADGTLNDILYFVTDGTVTDTLAPGAGNNRGIGVMPNGNIVYVQAAPTKAIIIDYQTKARVTSALLPEVGSSPTAPAIDENGNIYVGPVAGGNIVIYDENLDFVENAVEGPPFISRTMEVSKDGFTIYWMPFTGLKTYVYTRADEFSGFELTDSIHENMSIESSAWQPETGLLWVSNDGRGTAKSNLTWYGYDTETNTFVDSFKLAPSATPADELPRALDFSPDGKAAYVGLFGTAFDRVYKFVQEGTGVELEEGVVVEDYALEQNYPNPFNPSTTISFSIPEAGMVTLKVYDMLGQEVATLVNEELAQGQFNVDFNASNLSSGTYIYQLNTQGATIAKKMMLLK